MQSQYTQCLNKWVLWWGRDRKDEDAKIGKWRWGETPGCHRNQRFSLIISHSLSLFRSSLDSFEIWNIATCHIAKLLNLISSLSLASVSKSFSWLIQLILSFWLNYRCFRNLSFLLLFLHLLETYFSSLLQLSELSHFFRLKIWVISKHFEKLVHSAFHLLYILVSYTTYSTCIILHCHHIFHSNRHIVTDLIDPVDCFFFFSWTYLPWSSSRPFLTFSFVSETWVNTLSHWESWWINCYVEIFQNIVKSRLASIWMQREGCIIQDGNPINVHLFLNFFNLLSFLLSFLNLIFEMFDFGF